MGTIILSKGELGFESGFCSMIGVLSMRVELIYAINGFNVNASVQGKVNLNEAYLRCRI